MKPPPPSSSPSFALISVLALVSLAALTATAFLASARLERQATRSIGNQTQLDMALSSGMECAAQTINIFCEPKWNTAAAYWRGTNTNDWTNEIGYLLLGRPYKTNDLRWFYFCGFSPAVFKNIDTNSFLFGGTNIRQDSYLADIESFMKIMTNNFVANPPATNTNCTQIPLLGGRTSPPVGWVYIFQPKPIAGTTNTTNTPVARFAYFMEDLQGYIDAERMGGLTNRNTGTNPQEICLTNMLGTNSTNFCSSSNRIKYLSPGMMIYAGGITNSNLAYVATHLLSWTNSPQYIPIGVPVSSTNGYSSGGTNKFNLNNLATNPGSAGAAVTNIALILTSNLTTNFLARAGGLITPILYSTNDFAYAKCLAANIVDYIDADSLPTALDAAQGFRGTEALPYCTEFALRFRIEDGLTTQCDDKTNSLSIVPANSIRPSINAYLELWNPHATNIPLSKLGISFKSYGTNLPTSEEACAIGCNQFVKTIDELAANYANGSSGSLTNLTFNFATAIASNNVNPLTDTLAPNAYCVIKLDHDHKRLYPGPVNSNNWLKKGDYRFIYSGNTNDDRFLYTSKNTPRFIAACTNLPGSKEELDVAASDKCQAAVLELSTTNVGGTKIVYDRTRNILLNNNNIEIKDVANEGNNYSAFSLGLLSYKVGANNLNTGDPRINYFLRQSNNGILCSANAFTSSSFGGPNSNSTVPSTGSSFSTAPPTTCKVDITQWPDGGHNPTKYGVNPSGINPQRIPANEPISNSIVAFESNNAPSFIRNGPMTNILELGNIYDPILWRRVEKGNITINSIADPSFGGGNTLRIGRPEHPRFAFTNYSATNPPIPDMGRSAAALLDIFCITNNVDSGGKINLNTAPAPVLRALALGINLKSDASLLAGGSTTSTTNYSVPVAMAEAFAQGVMRFRSKYPFLTPSHLSFIGTDPSWPNTTTWPSNSVFGNTNLITLTSIPGALATEANIGVTEWNDQAAEEWFSKIYHLSTVQSFNYRVYVVAQLVGTNLMPKGAMAKKYYHLYLRNNSTTAISAGPFMNYQSAY